MSDKEIEARVHSLFALVMEINAPVAPALSRAEEPKWNSLKHVELMLALEDAFGLRFSEDEMMRADNLSSIVSLVARAKKVA